jgi:hypothetical protein
MERAKNPPHDPPEPPPAENDAAYDEVLDESFPASDPPPGIIKLGPPPVKKRGSNR